MEPVDCNLYKKTKKHIYNKYPKHSAYRSGLLVQKYKKDFTKKYGNKKQPYIGKRTRKRPSCGAHVAILLLFKSRCP